MSDSEAIYRFDDVLVDASAFRVSRAGEVLALEPKAVDVLLFLIERTGQLVSKQELLDSVWKDVAVTDNALTRVVAQLRRGLGDEARRARYIETVPTRGYRFVAAVERVPAVDAPRLPGPSTGPAPAVVRTPTGSSWRRPMAIAAFAAAVVAAWAGSWIWTAARSTAPGALRPVGPPVQLTSWTGLDLFPAASPDGSSIVYASDRSGGLELWRVPLAPDGRDLQLTSDGQENCEPSWSPDGRQIAYHSRRRGGIWIVSSLGGAARQLAPFGSKPAFSPDGRLVAFQSDPISDLAPSGPSALPGSTLWVVPLDGNSPRPMTTRGEPRGAHASPAWSPDGARLAFISHSPLGAELWTVRVVDRRVQRLGGDGTVSDPVYAPDGRAIFFATAKEPFAVWRIGVSPTTGEPEGDPVQLFVTGTRAVRHLSVTPDGQAIAYVLMGTTSNLLSIELSPATGEATGAPRPFTSDTSHRNTLPVFSPDGQHVAFLARRGGMQPDIWVADADGSRAAPLTTDPGPDVEPQWFPDGDRLFFVAYRAGRAGLWETRVSTRQERPLDLAPALAGELRRLQARLFQVHPDGSRLVFAAAEGDVHNLWTAGLDSGEVRRLTAESESIQFPRWSHDGRWIAAGIKRGEDTQVAIVSAAGGSPRIVTSGRGQHWAQSWTPDNRRVAYAGLVDGRWNVWSVDVASGATRRLTSYDRPAIYVRYPAWSPRGERIVFEYGDITGNVWMQRLDAGR